MIDDFELESNATPGLHQPVANYLHSTRSIVEFNQLDKNTAILIRVRNSD